MNLYRYVENAGTGATDPSGLEIRDLIHELKPTDVQSVLERGFKGQLWTRTSNAPPGGGEAWQAENCASIKLRVDLDKVDDVVEIDRKMVTKWYKEGFERFGTQAAADAYRWEKVKAWVKDAKGSVFRLARKQGAFYIFKGSGITQASPLIVGVEGAPLTGAAVTDRTLLSRLKGFGRNSVQAFKTHGARVFLAIAIARDVYEIYTAESWEETIVRKAYGWEGAVIGAWGGGTLSAVGGQCGPQALAPEEVVTVPLGALIGGIIGWNAGSEVAEVILRWRVAPGMRIEQ